jgi:hypothetical protein
VDGWQQYSHQCANNGNDDEKLDKSDTATRHA